MMSVYHEILLVIILPYLAEVVTYTTPLYFTSVLKCNGGVARTHVCNQINYIIIMFYTYLLNTKTGCSHVMQLR